MNRISLRGLTARLRDDQRGIALPMVLTIFLIGVALITAFLVAIVGSAQVSSTTSRSIQAQAAADAGIAAATAALTGPSYATTSFCTTPAQRVSGTDPQYDVTITCDSNSAPTKVTLTSVGTSPQGARSKVEAVFKVDAGVVELVNGASFYIGGLIGGLNGVTVTSSVTPPAPFVVSTGDFTCEGGGVSIPGDLYVANGNANLNTGCTFGGTLYVNGNVIDTSGGTKNFKAIHATGNVTLLHSLGTAADPKDVYAGGNIIFENQTMTIGNAYAKGSIEIRTNNLTVAGKLQAGGTIAGGSANGNNKVSIAYLAGKTFPNSTSVPSNSVPAPEKMPKWVDYGFDPQVWRNAGYTVKTLTSSECTPDWNALAETSTRTVVDARNCGTNLTLTPRTIQLKSDFAIVAKGAQFSWSNWTIRGTGAGGQQFSLLTPDTNLTNKAPDCGGSSKFTLQNVTVESTARINIYTPCGVDQQSGFLRGGVFSNGYTAGAGSPKLEVGGVSFPGATFGQPFGTGTGTGTGGTGSGGGGGTTLVPGVPTLSGGLAAKPLSQRNLG